jgi:hypothetical protein
VVCLEVFARVGHVVILYRDVGVMYVIYVYTHIVGVEYCEYLIYSIWLHADLYLVVHLKN